MVLLVLKSTTKLNGKITSIFHYNALLRIWNVINMNFFVHLYNFLICLSVSYNFKIPQMSHEKTQNLGERNKFRSFLQKLPSLYFLWSNQCSFFSVLFRSCKQKKTTNWITKGEQQFFWKKKGNICSDKNVHLKELFSLSFFLLSKSKKSTFSSTVFCRI